MSRDDRAASVEALKEHGVTITEPQGELQTQLQAAGNDLFESWQERAGEQAEQLVSDYRKRQAAQ